MRAALRAAAAIVALGLPSAGAAAVRGVIIGTVVLGFWPLIAVAGRRLGGPRSQ